jgi:hypothetical protein
VICILLRVKGFRHALMAHMTFSDGEKLFYAVSLDSLRHSFSLSVARVQCFWKDFRQINFFSLSFLSPP